MCHESTNPFFNAPGTCAVRVVRKANVRWVRLDVIGGHEADYDTGELAAGISFPLKAGEVYTLFLAANRLDKNAGDGVVEVTIEVNGSKLVDRECRATGREDIGDWAINCN